MAGRFCVLFDLDGTLTQSEDGIWNCIGYMADKLGVPRPAEEKKALFVGPPLEYSFKNYMGLPDERIPEALAAYRERYFTIGFLENRVYPGIRRLMRTLKKRDAFIAVCTGKPEIPTRKILSYFGFDRWVDALACATDGHAEKEDLIKKVVPEDAGEVWMVGDRRFDMEGGNKAGVHTLGVTYGYGTEEELREAGAEKIAHSVQEVIDLLCPGIQPPEGAFLSIEGLDGSGKSTQINKLTDNLKMFGFEVVHSREPGGCPISEKVRDILLDRENTEMEDVTEAILYAASRAQHVRQVIRPVIASGKVMLCDRFVDSSVAYQGGGRQLGVDYVLGINAPAVDGTLPIATVYLDIDSRASLQRRVNASEPDRIEMESANFHARVEAAYHDLIRRDPERFVVVDAKQSPDEIAEKIWQEIRKRLTEAEA